MSLNIRLAALVLASLALPALAAPPADKAPAAPAATKSKEKAEQQSLAMPALQALDLNGDGHVSRQEFTVGQRAFARNDRDKDGTVKLAEVATDDGGRAKEQLARMDLDGNGEVSRDEANKWRDRQFDALDTNKDGQLSPEEAKPGQGPRGMGALDRDGNGLLSSDEFASGSALFERFDTDGDGLLRKGDFPAGPDPARTAARFDNLDGNHDGVVTRDEVAAARRALFKQLDANGDGSLDKAELAAATAAHQAD